MFYYSRDRGGEHPQAHLTGYAGILQADAYDGYNKLYLADRKPGTIREAACWVHARRPFFAMADLEENARRKATGKKEIPLSPIAIEVVRRIDALFEIERSINGKSPQERMAIRQRLSRPMVDDLRGYMREQAARLSRGHDLVKAVNYMLKRWHAFILFLGMAASASRPTPPSEGCAASRSEENHGCSAGLIAVVDALLQCTVSLSRQR